MAATEWKLIMVYLLEKRSKPDSRSLKGKKKGGQLATKRETAEHHLGGGSLGYRYDYREQQCSANRTCYFYQNNQAKSVSAAIHAMFNTKPIRIISFCLI